MNPIVSLVRDLEINQGLSGFGYLVAVTPAMYQQKDGTVVAAPGRVTLYFQSKPMSPRGKLRGVPKEPFTAEPDSRICVGWEQP